jgi:hypothetical protein
MARVDARRLADARFLRCFIRKYPLDSGESQELLSAPIIRHRRVSLPFRSQNPARNSRCLRVEINLRRSCPQVNDGSCPLSTLLHHRRRLATSDSRLRVEQVALYRRNAPLDSASCVDTDARVTSPNTVENPGGQSQHWRSQPWSDHRPKDCSSATTDARFGCRIRQPGCTMAASCVRRAGLSSGKIERLTGARRISDIQAPRRP